MRSTAKVTYTDGHVDEAPLTPRVIKLIKKGEC